MKNSKFRTELPNTFCVLRHCGHFPHSEDPSHTFPWEKWCEKRTEIWHQENIVPGMVPCLKETEIKKTRTPGTKEEPDFSRVCAVGAWKKVGD